MQSNLPIKKSESIFYKISMFFKKLFYNSYTKKNCKEDITPENIIQQNSNNMNFKKNIKFESNHDYVEELKREELLDGLEDKLDLFYKLPTEKLEILKGYYIESIKKLEEKLAKINDFQ